MIYIPSWLIDLLIDAGFYLGGFAFDYIIRKAEDAAGNAIIEFVQEFDDNSDGIIDREVVIHSIEALIPDLDSPYNLVSDGDTVGLGMPLIEVIDGLDLISYIDFSDPFNMPEIMAAAGGYLMDLDGDDENDDILVSLPDFNGDGVPEFGWIQDLDDNGVPDLAPDSPYYPVGSEQYYEIIDTSNGQDSVMSKDLNDYTVTEGMLFILVILTLLNFAKGLFKKREVF